MNSNGILTREIANDIKQLDDAEAPKACGLGPIVKVALTRALRLAESAYKGSNRNTWLLAILIALQVKEDAFSIVLAIAKLFGG